MNVIHEKISSLKKIDNLRKELRIAITSAVKWVV